MLVLLTGFAPFIGFSVQFLQISNNFVSQYTDDQVGTSFAVHEEYFSTMLFFVLIAWTLFLVLVAEISIV